MGLLERWDKGNQAVVDRQREETGDLAFLDRRWARAQLGLESAAAVAFLAAGGWGPGALFATMAVGKAGAITVRRRRRRPTADAASLEG